MKLFVATHNAHKVREIGEILPDFEIVPDDPEGVEENAPDFAGNALIKVRAIAARHAGAWCMADDSGLEVKALGGAPGVRSARYAGEPSNTPNNNALLLKNLAGVTDRTANFTCAIALVDPEGKEHVVEGKCFGHVAESPSGAAGFGYDPLFIPDGYTKSFAELTADEKNAISHRGRALAEAKKVFAEHGGRGGHGVTALPLATSVPSAPSRTQPQGDYSHPWLRFFRIVNLPTVPGDVLVGAAAVLTAWDALLTTAAAGRLAAAAVASLALYLFGLADNDIVGAKTDKERPIPNGEISLRAARHARTACWALVLVAGAAASLPPTWWVVNFLLFLTVVAYNRTKDSFLMGVCRGLNVLAGAAAIGTLTDGETLLYAGSAAVVWTLYIAGVTWYSKGEETSPAKKRAVGILVGMLVYLQLLALLAFALAPSGAGTRGLLVAGAALLILLRVFQKVFPKVSAS